MKTELQSRFSGHVPNETCIQKMRELRAAIRSLASHIEAECPEGREKATAFTHLQSVMMFANSAIVQGYPVDPKEEDK